MKVCFPAKLRGLGLVIIFSSVMVLGQAKQADAYGGSGEAGIAFLVVAAAATYATIMSVACTPIAAVKADDYPGGFSGAFGDCFSLDLKSDTNALAETIDGTTLTLTEEDDNNRDRDND